jgi:hypothetical protein
LRYAVVVGAARGVERNGRDRHIRDREAQTVIRRRKRSVQFSTSRATPTPSPHHTPTSRLHSADRAMGDLIYLDDHRARCSVCGMPMYDRAAGRHVDPRLDAPMPGPRVVLRSAAGASGDRRGGGAVGEDRRRAEAQGSSGRAGGARAIKRPTGRRGLRTVQVAATCRNGFGTGAQDV